MSERPYQPGQDDAAVLALRAKVWGADHPHTDPAFFEWLFQESPGGTGAGIVSERDGTIVGFAATCSRSGQIGGRPIRIGHGMEFMVDPDLGRMGSGRLARRVIEKHITLMESLGYDCTLNYPNDNSRRFLTQNRVKYDPVFEPELFVRPLPRFAMATADQPSSVKQLAVSFSGKLGAVYSDLRSFGSASKKNVVRIDRFDGRFDRHWAALQTDGKIRFNRDAKTLNWRYIDHPLYQYSIFASASDGEIDGYIVTSPRHIMGIDARLICDFCVADRTEKTRQRLLNAAISDAKANGDAALVCQSLPHSPANKSLRRCGFVRVPAARNPKPFLMVAISFHPSNNPVLTGQNWAFNWGDMDVV